MADLQWVTPERHPTFAPVIDFPKSVLLLDLSTKEAASTDYTEIHPYGIGKYNEYRPHIYQTPIFSPDSTHARNIHIGVDLFAPVGAPVYAFQDSTLIASGYNTEPGDYGGVLILETQFDGCPLYALYGHLDPSSFKKLKPGQGITRGETIARLGDRHQNGGYPPHLHFQLSIKKPETRDMPGAVSQRDLPSALLQYPDPRLVLGKLY